MRSGSAASLPATTRYRRATVSRLSASHRTEIRYAGYARESVNQVRMLPVSGESQRVLDASVTIWPEAPTARYLDVYGNAVIWFQIVEPHERLVIEARAEVELFPPRRGAEPPPEPIPWETLADPAYREEHAEFLRPSRHVRWGGSVEDFARDLVLPEIGVERWLRELEAGVSAGISYTPGVTAVETPIERVIDIRRGVCQDMAHVFIALARRKGVAARYVSGWLHTPGNGDPSESHAWVEAAVPGRGWLGFDPTHPETGVHDYVRVAQGRDYADAAPIRGNYIGAPPLGQEITVTVVPSEAGAAA